MKKWGGGIIDINWALQNKWPVPTYNSGENRIDYYEDNIQTGLNSIIAVV